MDFGCGSGLFSIAAAHLGAWPVYGVDLDPDSIQTSKTNNERWLPGKTIQLVHLSVLNDAGMANLPMVDVGYAWGSLHQTGAMQKSHSQLCITCQTWRSICNCNIQPSYYKPAMASLLRNYTISQENSSKERWYFTLTPIIALAKFLATGQNPYRTRRGMNMKHNVIDWVGGYPYEYGSIKGLTVILENENLVVEKAIPANVPTGCNEFVCIKKS